MFSGVSVCWRSSESNGGNDRQHAPGELWEVREGGGEGEGECVREVREGGGREGGVCEGGR